MANTPGMGWHKSHHILTKQQQTSSLGCTPSEKKHRLLFATPERTWNGSTNEIAKKAGNTNPEKRFG
jgi:hypothetical protein